MDWTLLAELLRDNPTAAATLAGAVVALGIQIAKKAGWTLPGQQAGRKIAVAVVAALLLSAGAQYLSGEWEWGGFVSAAVTAWLASAGVHGTFLRSGQAERADAKVHVA